MSREMEVGSTQGQAMAALRAVHLAHGETVRERLLEFCQTWRDGREEDIFAELCFCLLTPQTNAHAGDAAVKELVRSDLLMTGRQQDLAVALARWVRFHRNKARYIVRARETFSDSGKLKVRPLLREQGAPHEMRDWLVRNVLGLGYKEASHFLRNVGLGEGLAILDRHILRNLVEFGVLEALPRALTRKRYLEIEEKMRSFAARVGIPMAELDLLLWSKETGEVFK